MYKNEWKIFREYYLKHVVVVVAMFLLSAIIAYITLNYISNHQGSGAQEKVMGEIQNLFEDKGFSNDMSGLEMMVTLFINNSTVSATALLFGLIPIVVIPYWVVLTNGAVLGLVLSITESMGSSTLEMLVFGILPHGVTELGAILLSAGMGSFVSITLVKKIFKKSTMPFKELMMMTGKTFMVLVIPLLLISAVIESFLTPILINFMG